MADLTENGTKTPSKTRALIVGAGSVFDVKRHVTYPAMKNLMQGSKMRPMVKVYRDTNMLMNRTLAEVDWGRKSLPSSTEGLLKVRVSTSNQPARIKPRVTKKNKLRLTTKKRSTPYLKT